MGTFEKAPPDVKELLSKPIRDLGLKLEGSSVERFVHQLYRELEQKGLKKFRRLVYIRDEWGCPSEEPVIGIQLYCTVPEAHRRDRDMHYLEDSLDSIMSNRHE